MLLAPFAAPAFWATIGVIARGPDHLRRFADGVSNQALGLRPRALQGDVQGRSCVGRVVLPGHPDQRCAALVQGGNDVGAVPVFRGWFFCHLNCLSLSISVRRILARTCQHVKQIFAKFGELLLTFKVLIEQMNKNNELRENAGCSFGCSFRN
jgi:hypothetical protein